MEPNETTSRPPQPTKADPTPTPTDAELSRIAREAVRQPADPRLDKQLERMGLTDAPAPEPAAAPPVSPTSVPVTADPTVEALGRRLRRVESIVWLLVVAVVVLAVAVVVLLLR